MRNVDLPHPEMASPETPSPEPDGLTVRVTNSLQEVHTWADFDLEDAPPINTGTGAWTPNHGQIRVRTPLAGMARPSIALLLDGPNSYGVQQRYTFGLPHGMTRGSGENPVIDNLLVTDLPEPLQRAVEAAVGVDFSEYA
ncbi:hypothetical protein GCG21_08755 [Pseudactinotalea sp. HY160]|uniref:hypothetical protein n=1 Tax=Pseudactinotalea sp. HY160 TaxID=2654490 RepID=UPI00128DFC2A|nr:hypothetical protein [Pseudactinotalea sp. HY160]MPV50094.1 hypothetical protein [Pseudactinotalea sp. HY160]